MVVSKNMVLACYYVQNMVFLHRCDSSKLTVCCSDKVVDKMHFYSWRNYCGDILCFFLMSLAKCNAECCLHLFNGNVSKSTASCVS